MMSVSKALSQWSRNVIGDIFETAKIIENKIYEIDQTVQQDDNESTKIEFNKLNDEYILHTRKVNSFWK